jgi:hypothetical protein
VAVAPAWVDPDGVEVSGVASGVTGAVVVVGFVPGVALADAPGTVPAPGAGADPDVLEAAGLAGVVAAGLGLAAGGLLEELDGLGFGDGLGDGFGALAVAAGGAVLGAAPAPNANPMTLPGAGS